MTRYSLFYAAACLAMIAGFVQAAEPARPNIVLIMADDLGYGDLSCYGQKHFATPSIDSLAAEGMKFSQHYSGSTVCAPTRCSLMTGYHTGHCFVRGNREHQPIGQEPIPADTLTIAKVCQKAGYKTGMFGKWGLGYPGSVGDPTKQGFDEFFGYNCQRNAHTYYPTWLYHNEKQIKLDGETYSEDLITKHALKFIRDNHDQPFFCYLPVTIPHAAMHVPASYSEPFRKQFPQFENTIGRYAGTEVRNPVAAFAGMCTKMDEGVSRVMSLLKELKIDDNTLVIFTSDNGPHLEGGHKPEFFNSNGPLNGHKRNLTEGGIRAPMLARWPGKIKAGSKSDHISAHWDVFATICELIGADAPKDTDGISFVPELTGGEQKQHEYLYWEFHSQGGKRAVRKGDWKAVQRNVGKNPAGPILLFNLKDDLGEKTNLADKHPKIVAEMREIMEEAHVDSAIFNYRRK
jgi:arylsulfatase A-like enzyme